MAPGGVVPGGFVRAMALHGRVGLFCPSEGSRSSPGEAEAEQREHGGEESLHEPFSYAPSV
jgi:hypothetical protein